MAYPVAHGVQLVCALVVVLLPVAHTVQCATGEPSEYVPAGHAVHATSVDAATAEGAEEVAASNAARLYTVELNVYVTISPELHAEATAVHAPAPDGSNLNPAAHTHPDRSVYE